MSTRTTATIAIAVIAEHVVTLTSSQSREAGLARPLHFTLPGTRPWWVGHRWRHCRADCALVGAGGGATPDVGIGVTAPLASLAFPPLNTVTSTPSRFVFTMNPRHPNDTQWTFAMPTPARARRRWPGQIGRASCRGRLEVKMLEIST